MRYLPFVSDKKTLLASQSAERNTMSTSRYDDLNEKVVLITGSGRPSGIGFSIAEAFAQNGANIVLSDIVTPEQSEQQMQENAKKLTKQYGIEAMFQVLDVTDFQSINPAVVAIEKRFGKLDILINNAGTAFGAPSSFANYDEEAWIKTVDLNLHGVFRVSQACCSLIEKQKGSIINLSSRAGKVPNVFNGAYAAAKAAVLMFTKVQALELASSGVRVNAICPGLIKTELQDMRIDLEAKMQGISFEERREALTSTVPLGYMAEVSEVASVVTFLASQAASHLTGQGINICGGMTMTL